MKLFRGILLFLSPVMLSGCPLSQPLDMPPATYLGWVSLHQCYADIAPELNTRSSTNPRTPEEVALWRKHVVRCQTIGNCLETKLFATNNFDYDDWSVIRDFYEPGYGAKNDLETMRARISPDNAIALERFASFEKIIPSCLPVTDVDLSGGLKK